MAGRGAQVRVDGLRDLKRDLKRLVGDLGDVKAASAAAGALVARAAAPRAPRRTGRLASSVRPAATVGGVAVRSALPYAGPLHWGWAARRITANPFIADAALATEPAWLALYMADIQKAVDRVNGRTY